MLQFACYRGRSLVSRLIQGFSRSVYSHVAITFGEGAEIHLAFEAIGQGFVRSWSLGANHEPGTIIDLFAYRRPLSDGEYATALRTANTLVGQEYDYASVFLGFPLRLAQDGDRRRLFCSEAALAIAWSMGEERLLQRMLPWKATPDHIAISPLLEWKGTVTL